MTAPPGFHDFGYWRDTDGRRGLVTWHERTGHVQWLGPRRLELLAVIDNIEEVRRCLDGWASAAETEGIDWVRVRLNPASCESCGGEGWVQSNWDDGAVQVACHCAMDMTP